MSNVSPETQRSRDWTVKRGVEKATKLCELAESMPESCGYLPAPSKGSGEYKSYWTPEALRRTIELDIIRQAQEVNHQALAVYRDHGIPLAIFERYDRFLDNQDLYNPHAREILDRGNEFPNPLEAYGAAILGYANKSTGEGAAVTNEDLAETLTVLSQMGAKRYLIDPQYASKMLRQMEFNFGLHRKNPDRYRFGIAKFLEAGGPSLCLSYDTNLSQEESISKIMRRLKNLDGNVGQHCSADGSVVRDTQPSMAQAIDRQFDHTDFLTVTMDVEISKGNSDLDPVLVFNRFVRALTSGDVSAVKHLAENTNLSEILKTIHEQSNIVRSPDKILQAEKPVFTPLMMLRAIDGSSVVKQKPELMVELFNAASDAGLKYFLQDQKHVLALAKGYKQKGMLNLNKFEPIQDLLRTHLTGVSFESAMQLCERHPKLANPAALDHAKTMLQADKKSAMALTSDSTIEKIFAANFSEAYQSVLKLTPEDAMLSECPLSKSFEFRGKAFTQALGV